MNEETNYFEIDLVELLSVFLHRAWAIILAGVICAGIAFSYAYYAIAPTYRSDVLLYVNGSSLSVGSTALKLTGSDLKAARDIVSTYLVILRSRSTLEAVKTESGLDYSTTQLDEMIQADAVNSTEVFKVAVTCTDYEHAEIIANSIAKVLPERISDIIDGTSVRIVDYAIKSPNKIGPNLTKYSMIGFLLGFVVFCGITFLGYMSDTTVKTEEYITKTYSLPILSAVPDLLKSGGNGKYKSGYYGKDYRKKHDRPSDSLESDDWGDK